MAYAQQWVNLKTVYTVPENIKDELFELGQDGKSLDSIKKTILDVISKLNQKS